MRTRMMASLIVAAVAICASEAMAQSWSFPGLGNAEFTAAPGRAAAAA